MPLEDLFTEAVARLFETRPQLCLAWLHGAGLIATQSTDYDQNIRVTTQKSFVALEDHGSGSRPDLILEVHHAVENAELGGSVDVVMIESKIGSVEGEDQLKRYAGHLSGMSGTAKTLVYITRAYDPKDSKEILSEIDGVSFKQIR